MTYLLSIDFRFQFIKNNDALLTIIIYTYSSFSTRNGIQQRQTLTLLQQV